MQQFSGTPNEWHVRQGLHLEVIADKTGFGVICFGSPEELKSADYPMDEAIANAKLCAAAPNLLKALQKVYSLATQIGLAEDLDFEEEDYMAAAINKALN